MDVQKIAHAVSGAVIKVHPFFPENFPCGQVKSSPAAPLKKYGVHQPEHGSRRHGKVFLFLPRDAAQCKGAGDIGRSFHIMPARICKQHLSGMERSVCLRGSTVMNDGPVGAKRTDGRKGRFQITVLLRAEIFKLIRCAHLGQRFSRIRIRQRLLFSVLSGRHTAHFKPVHEFCAGDGIFKMRVSDVQDLCVVFPALYQDFRILLPDDLHPWPGCSGKVSSSPGPDPAGSAPLPEAWRPSGKLRRKVSK